MRITSPGPVTSSNHRPNYDDDWSEPADVIMFLRIHAGDESVQTLSSTDLEGTVQGPATHLQRPPLAVLHSEQVVREAQLDRELLQHVDTEARAALEVGAVLLCQGGVGHAAKGQMQHKLNIVFKIL